MQDENPKEAEETVNETCACKDDEDDGGKTIISSLYSLHCILIIMPSCFVHGVSVMVNDYAAMDGSGACCNPAVGFGKNHRATTNQQRCCHWKLLVKSGRHFVPQFKAGHLKYLCFRSFNYLSLIHI